MLWYIEADQASDLTPPRDFVPEGSPEVKGVPKLEEAPGLGLKNRLRPAIFRNYHYYRCWWGNRKTYATITTWNRLDRPWVIVSLRLTTVIDIFKNPNYNQPEMEKKRACPSTRTTDRCQLFWKLISSVFLRSQIRVLPFINILKEAGYKYELSSRLQRAICDGIKRTRALLTY